LHRPTIGYRLAIGKIGLKNIGYRFSLKSGNRYNTTENSQQQIINTVQQPAKGPTDISTALSFVLVEEKERSKQQLNLIIHNLEEASGDDAEARKHPDIQKTVDIFQHLGVKATINNAL